MYDGYLRYGGVELINAERLAAYVANGITPRDMRVDPPEACEGLAEALSGGAWEPYRSPIQDEPPWFDASNPDTYDFAGLLPLSITGMDDTTRTVEMTPTVRDGALPGSARRGPRTVGVTALLVGRSTEGVQAGLAWLRNALHGDCEAAEADCGPSAMLEAFTACPGPITPTADLNLPPVPHTSLHPNDPEDPSFSWVARGATFTEDAGDGTLLEPYQPDPNDGGTLGAELASGGGAEEATDDTEDGGSAGDPSDLLVDAGGAGSIITAGITDGGGANPLADVIDSGGAGPLPSEATLTGPRELCSDGPVTITWSLRPEFAVLDMQAQLVILDDSGSVVEYGPKYDLAPTMEDYEWELPFGVDHDTWRPGIIVSYPVVVASVTTTAYPSSTPLDCIGPYWRFLPNTVTTSGPTVVGTVEGDCATLLRVEWVWVVGSPYRYGVTTTVLASLSQEEDPTLVLPGVTWGQDGVIDATPWDCDPPAPPTPCAIDPGSPGFGIPPAAPRIPDPTVADITTQDVRSMWVCVGPEQVPVNDGVFTISLTASNSPIVGARVRVWDTAEGDCTVPDDCAFAYEYLIDYVPADGVFIIDGVRGGFNTLCDGGNVLADSSGVVRGDFGGPTKEPVARCDRRYLILVQWLDTYPRTVPTFYTEGDPEGDLTVAVAVTNREG